MKKRILSLVLALAICSGLCVPGAMAVTEEAPVVPEAPVAFVAAGAARQTQNFNYDWKFHLGDVPGGEVKGYDDSAWRSLTLPHDYSIEQDFTNQGGTDGGTGWLPGGVGWYRKTFVLPAAMAGKRISLSFGGVYMDSSTYINGTLAGNYPYGYSTFAYDITDMVVADGVTKNVVAVRVNNQLPSSRWYSGSGIYRNVDLVITEPVHVQRYGTFVTTPNLATEYGNNQAVVNVKTKVENDGAADASSVIVKSTIYDAAGAVFAETAATAAAPVAKGAVVEFEQNITTPKPLLWDTKTPNLYTMVTEVVVDEAVTDRYETTFGFRWTTFDSNEGFSLNGEYMKLNGVCMHHDQGALGAVANERAIERQMQTMKDMGVNSIRVTHNPAADELLEICNRMGLLVIDEAFDCWESGKRSKDYGRFFTKPATHPDAEEGETWAEFDVKNMVNRGKNDPCIIMWSIGNEIVGASVPTATKLNGWVKEVDTTRPTTQGYNNFIGSFSDGGMKKVAEVTDVAGFNYGESGNNPSYDRAHNVEYPGWVIAGTETSSAVRTRGYYKNDSTKLIRSCYDDSGTVGWGSSMEHAWQMNRDRKWLLGEYMWTGFDYIGEPSPYGGWPSKSSYFGAVDTAGIPKDAFYMYQSVWTDVAKNPMVHLMPHWNWEGDAGYSIKDAEGKIRVQAYTNAPAVELFLNEASLGKQTFEQKNTSDGRPYQELKDHIYLEWMVPYVKGELKAVAYDANGEIIATDVIRTAGAPAQIRLTPDREVITADGLDLSYILVEVLDKDGNVVPTADNQVNFQVSGNGIIAGVDNGSQTAVDERYKDNKRKAFSGKAMLIIQSTTEAGPVTISATSAGLTGAKTTVFTNADESGSPVLLGYEALPEAKTAINTQPVLPEQITAVYSDGSRSPAAVTWDAIADGQLSALGQFTVKGTVSSTGDKVAITVIVFGALGLQEVSIVTAVGTVPALPDKVAVIYNTGETGAATVHWERALTADDVAAEGTIILTGTVDGFAEKARATVRVRTGVLVYKNDIAKKDGAYPIPTASFVAGDPVAAINNGTVNYVGGGAGERWIPWGHNVPSEWCQLELERAHTIGKAGIDIWNNVGDDKMSLPDTLTVQCSMTGEDGSWTDAASLTRDEIDGIDGKADRQATKRLYLEFSAPVEAKFVRWKFDNEAKKSTGVSEVHIYEQSVELPVETGAKLAEIKVNNVALEGFTPEVSSYIYPLPYGAGVPEVTATAQGNATLFITPALDTAKAATIMVTSEDGANTSYYTVQFQEAAPALERVELSLGGTELVEDDVLPITLTATMQDGTVLTPDVIEVVYTVGDSTVAKVEGENFCAYRAGSTTFKAAVTYRGVTVGSALLHLTIAPNMAGKTITGYEQITVTTDKGAAPRLPGEITATFDVGLSKTVPVRWDNIPAEKYADYGSFTVKGTVEGQSLRAIATVEVKGIVGVQQFSATTPVRFLPELPAKARVYFSDGTKGELPVIWQECTREEFKTSGDVVTVRGAVDANGVSLPTAMTVRVSDATRFGDTFTQYKNGFYLPLPFATYTNHGAGGNGTEKIYDGITTSSTVSNAPDQNCWNNWTSSARAGDTVGFVFGLEEVVDKSLDQLDIYFYSDSGVAVPAGCVIEYYTGADFGKGDIPQYPENDLPGDHLLAKDENWTPVPNLVAPESLTAHAKNTFTFDAISTCAIRVKMTAQSGKSLGIIEMQAHAKLVSDIRNLTALSGIALNGTALDGFAPEDTEYTCVVRGSALPEITATTGGNNESVTIVTANPAKVIVTAEDGVTTKTYTITFERPDLPPEGSKTYPELQALIAEAEQLLKDGIYTAASAGALQAAVDTAKVLTDEASVGDVTTQCAAVQAAINALALAPGKKIVAFTIPNQYGRTVIDERGGTIRVPAGEGTNLKALTPTIELSAGASVDPAGGVAQDFTGPVVYTVTASDGATRTYTVTVTAYVRPYNPPVDTGKDTTIRNNPDGSTTKTVTDRKTGEVTVTTTYKDGTKVVTTTPKGGAAISKISVPAGKKAKVTIPMEGATPGTVAVIILADGTEKIIKTSVAEDGGITFVAEGDITVKLVDNSKSFSDVVANHWAAEAIQFTASRELFGGTGENLFTPAMDMNGSMLVTVLARLKGVDTEGGATWYEKAADWAKSVGITDGSGLDKAVTRESIAVMMWRYAGKPQVEGEKKTFADSGDVSDWAAEAMDWAVKTGLIGGRNGNALDPQASATRAEVAVILQRFITQQNP